MSETPGIISAGILSVSLSDIDPGIISFEYGVFFIEETVYGGEITFKAIPLKDFGFQGTIEYMEKYIKKIVQKGKRFLKIPKAFHINRQWGLASRLEHRRIKGRQKKK